MTDGQNLFKGIMQGINPKFADPDALDAEDGELTPVEQEEYRKASDAFDVEYAKLTKSLDDSMRAIKVGIRAAEPGDRENDEQALSNLDSAISKL